MVRGELDPQNVAIVVALLAFKPLQDVLRHYGFNREARTMEVILAADEAMDVREMPFSQASASLSPYISFWSSCAAALLHATE